MADRKRTKPGRSPSRARTVQPQVVSGVPSAAVRAVEVIDEKHLAIEARQITKLYHASRRSQTEAAVTIGTRLEQIAARLEHGRYTAWIDASLPFSSRSADNYRALARWTTDHPKLAARLAHLGPTKLYMLATQAPATVRKLTARKTVARLDGSKTTLTALSSRDLTQILAQLKTGERPAPRGRKRDTGAFHRRLEKRLVALEKLLERESEAASALAPRVAQQLRRRVDAIGKRLGSAR